MELLDEIVLSLLDSQSFTADDISYLCLASNVLSQNTQQKLLA